MALYRIEKAIVVAAVKTGPLESRNHSLTLRLHSLRGAPDFLAVFHFIFAEGKEETVAPCAMLGAANHRINPEALKYFKGKHVCLYPHLDDAGHSAAKAWASQLRENGAYVEAFDLSGCRKTDGSMGKDLNDINFIDVDSYEKEWKFWEVLP